ncbi:Phosphoglycerate mutase family protein [uncultured Eubacteriales bacterium]|uniref:Phosphoglycerate mutase family protein n=1 Tax=uncultured Eubacteriales bacterium TaxID=172733 RepID=A0A212JPP9_9FIRM|nr:Phosphoglycerate mutase family protein [uncultured Eubacteriales bacterium]
MTRLYLIRHAEAEGNLYRRIQGWYDSLITDRGCRQIAALEHRFESIPIDAVYSSDLYRTMTTAAAVYRPKGLPLQIRADLREIHLGVWEDRSWGEVAYTDPERMRAFNNSLSTWSVEGGETFRQLGDRMAAAMLDIVAQNPGRTVAVFSHGMAIRALQGTLLGLPEKEWTTLGHGDNTCVTCIEVDEGRASILWRNDNSHLPEEISTLAKQSWWKAGSGAKEDTNLRYVPLDMEKDSELYYQARKEAWLSIHHTIQNFDGDGFVREAMDQWRVNPRSVTCAYLRSELVGLIQMDTSHYTAEGVGYIPFYYMTPKSRKNGMGVQLMGEAVSLYRQLGRDRLRLRCAPDNYVAQRFYQRYGFRKIGEAQGSRVPLDLLEKPIALELQVR